MTPGTWLRLEWARPRHGKHHRKMFALLALNAQGWKMGDWDRELVGVIIGFYFASRVLSRDRRIG